MPVLKYEKLVQCPYEKSHLITPDKQITHLTKCRKQHLKLYPNDPKIIICPYKSTHHVARTEYAHHLENCDSKDLATHMMLEASSSLKKQPVPIIEAQEKRNGNITDEEDWETQQIREPYDPAKAILDKEVIRKPVGLTKSERKIFCEKERERRKFLEERRKDKEKNEGVNDREFTSNFVVQKQSTTQKFLYNTEPAMPEATLRRPKVVAAPARAISPGRGNAVIVMPPKIGNTSEAQQSPKLRRPNRIFTPTRDLKEKMSFLDKSLNASIEDPYDKYIGEKMKEMSIK